MGELTIFRTIFALSSLLLSANNSMAAISVVAPTRNTNGSLQIAEDLSFVITTTGSVRAVVFDEWVPNNDRNDTTSNINAGLVYTLNSGQQLTAGQRTFAHDNWAAANLNAISRRDGYLFFGTNINVREGDTFTIESASYVLSRTNGFNPATTQNFMGRLFLVNQNGTIIGRQLQAVPEPSSFLLLAIGALPMLRRRR